MTKRRESRSGRNQVIWDQAPRWGKKKKNGERSERRGRSGEGKGWRFFSFPRPPLSSLCSPIFFLFDPVFYLLPPLLETKRGGEGFFPLSFPAMTSSLLFPAHFSLGLWTTGVVVCDRKNRGLAKTMTVWFKGAEMGTLHCSPYLKLNIFRSNPGSRIHPSRLRLLFSKPYLFTLSTQAPIQRSWMITSLHPVGGSA